MGYCENFYELTVWIERYPFSSVIISIFIENTIRRSTMIDNVSHYTADFARVYKINTGYLRVTEANFSAVYLLLLEVA